MAEISFYQLSRDPVERVVPLLAAKAFESGARVLVVSGDAAQRAAISDALWAREGDFLAHGENGGPDAARQPIMLSDVCVAANGASVAILADGAWRDEAAGLGRAMLLFGPDQTDAARSLWSALQAGGHMPRIFKQAENGGWREGR